MPSSYTSSLRLVLPVTGELSGTWGDTVNAGLTNLVDTAIAGRSAITMADANYTLTSSNGAADEARSMILDMSGTLTAARNVICPTSSKVYVIKNSTTGGFAITLKTTAGTGVSVANGKTMILYCDGTNVVEGVNYLASPTIGSLSLSTALTVANGGTGATTLTGLVKGNGTGAFTAAASGTDYAPATSGSSILKGNGSGGFSNATSGTDYAPATSGTSLLMGNGAGGFSNAASGTNYAPATSGSSILKGNGAGGFSNATSGTDYAPATSGSSLLKGNGAGGFSAATSGTDYAPATSGTAILKGSGAGGFSSTTAGTDYVAPATATNFTALQTFTGSTSVAASKFVNSLETITVSATAATGTINYDVTTQSVLYYTTNASANWTVNFRASSGTSLNTLMSTGESITVAFMVTQGGTAYYNSVVQVDSTIITPKWQGGTAPTSGNASSIDVYAYTIVKTGAATFTVFASQTRFA